MHFVDVSELADLALDAGTISRAHCPHPFMATIGPLSERSRSIILLLAGKHFFRHPVLILVISSFSSSGVSVVIMESTLSQMMG